jgi:hypothetical protein
VYAQASIAGVVKDASGAVLPGVTVEASSPALIEKVRSVVTDGSGQYRIVDLRPGAYVVTFTLTGFNTIKREGIDLSGFATTAVNAEMKVGALEETIIVSGESPVVDVQNTTKQSVLDHDVIDALPTNRNSFGLGILIPGTVNASGFGQDVGGITGTAPSALGSHGSRTQDQRLTINGVALSTMQGGGWGGALVPNAAGLAEQTIDTSAVTAELATGGVRINYIPRDGGNKFSGTAFASYANDAMQGTNLDDELIQRGLPTTRSLIKNWSVNPGLGGPLKRDKVWFYVSGQSLGSYLFAPGIFPNKNAGNPNAWTYEADTTKRAENDFVSTDYQLRLTWQAAQKQKIGFLIDYQSYCRCPAGVSATISPEAASDDRWPLQRPIQADWTSPLTNRLLLEASAIDRIERWGSMELGHGGNGEFASDPRMISVTEQSLGNLVYRSRATYSNNWNHTFHYRVAASYITGTHALKVGFNDAKGMSRNGTNANQPVSYLFNNFQPVSLTLRATPYTDGVSVDHDLGLFVQDKWTMGRFTLGVGLRYDHFASSFPDLSLGPSTLLPNRNLSFPARDNLSWHDITPKSSFAWDVTGDGKTAVKVSLNKYLEGMGLTGLTLAPSPIASLATDSATNRTWNDLTYPLGDPRRGNFVPDCDLLNPVANGECGVFSNPNFGTARNSTSFDPALLQGWGIRNYNWEFGASIQREIAPRVSVDFGFFRRWYGNFLAQDDRSVAASDFDTFAITVPRDARLPDGGGYVLSGLQILKPGAIGRPVDTYTTLVQSLPGSPARTEHWNGFDLSASVRPRNGLILNGGVSTGRTSEDYCDVAAQLPEFIALDRNGNRTTDPIFGLTPSCNYSTPFLTTIKGYGSYIIPKIDLQVGATLQNIPGPEVRAVYTLTNAILQGALGRNLLVAGANNTTVNVIERGSLYGERMNQVDFRVGKRLRFGQARTTLSLDIYNLLNGNAILTQNNTLAVDASNAVTNVWQRPQSILDARFVKVSAQFDF